MVTNVVGKRQESKTLTPRELAAEMPPKMLVGRQDCLQNMVEISGRQAGLPTFNVPVFSPLCARKMRVGAQGGEGKKGLRGRGRTGERERRGPERIFPLKPNLQGPDFRAPS